MANHKVMQDIEAEDKLIGPLSLKQFGYAAVTLVSAYITYLLIAKSVWYMSVMFWPVIILFGFLAFPWGRDQPTEIWLLAKIRFMLKPRRRIWDQEGLDELVTITAPKKQDVGELTKDFDREEAKSRLKALASTIDSRGWAVKGLDVNLYSQPASAVIVSGQDRLTDMGAFSAPQNFTDIHASDDMLDENSQKAQQMRQLLDASAATRRQELLQRMQAPAAPPTTTTTTDKNQAISPEEQAVLDRLHKENARPAPKTNLRVIEPLSKRTKSKKDSAKPTPALKAKTKAPEKPSPAPGSTSVNPAILTLANNDDLNVATIQRQANKASGGDSSDEVVISLH